MPGDPNPVEEIGGIDSATDVVKADIIAWAKANIGQVLADADDIRARSLAGQQLIVLKSTGAIYKSDTSDTTSADDGTTVINDFDGLRFKALVPLSLIPDVPEIGVDVQAWSALLDAFVAGFPSFSVTKSGNQNVADVTFTTITWETETSDIGGYFASDTYTPPAGTYILCAFSLVGGTFSAGSTVAIQIRKNGASLGQWTSLSSTGAAFPFIVVIATANGTDAFTVVGYNDTTGGNGSWQASGNCGFFGARIG